MSLSLFLIVWFCRAECLTLHFNVKRERLVSESLYKCALKGNHRKRSSGFNTHRGSKSSSLSTLLHYIFTNVDVINVKTTFAVWSDYWFSLIISNYQFHFSLSFTVIVKLTSAQKYPRLALQLCGGAIFGSIDRNPLCGCINDSDSRGLMSSSGLINRLS